jgi:hypothetical protein
MSPILLPILCSVLVNVAPPPTEIRTGMSPSLRRATAVYAIAGALDVASTAAFVLRGGHEGNPLLAPMQDKPALMLTVGVATSVTGVWAWNRFVGRKHPKIAAIGLYAAAGVHAFLAARNYQKHRDRVHDRQVWDQQAATFSLVRKW